MIPVAMATIATYSTARGKECNTPLPHVYTGTCNTYTFIQSAFVTNYHTCVGVSPAPPTQDLLQDVV